MDGSTAIEAVEDQVTATGSGGRETAHAATALHATARHEAAQYSAPRGRLRVLVVTLWLVLVAVAAYAYLAQRDMLEAQLVGALSASTLVGAAVYLISSCLRGFTLIPATFLLVAALPFFPPAPLYLMTMLGVVVSAASLYRFSHLFGMDRLLERRHPERLARLREVLQRNQFSIIVGWSFFPLVPTDLICYACGSLRTGFKRFLLAIIVGEGLICAAYVFLGDQILALLQLR